MLLIIRIRLNDFDQIESRDVLIHTLIFQLFHQTIHQLFDVYDIS